MFLVEYPRSHGWLTIYYIPFNDPILCLGFFSSKPFIKDFTSLDTMEVLGN